MKRAQTVRNTLIQRGVNAKRLHISGIIDASIYQTSEQMANQMARWVEFEPTLR